MHRSNWLSLGDTNTHILTIKHFTIHSGANGIGLGDGDVVGVSGKVYSTVCVSCSHIWTDDSSISQCHNCGYTTPSVLFPYCVHNVNEVST